MTASQSIGVIGGGAWGTALASMLRRTDRDVLLWARNAAVVDEINREHLNSGYLPGEVLDPRLSATSDVARVAARDVVLMVAPAQQTRSVLTSLAPFLRPGTPVVLCSKGIEQTSGLLLSEVLAETLPDATPAILSGPSFAHDVVRGLPAALTIATTDDRLGQGLAEAIGYRNFRLYWSDDLVGVQLGGAVKNVLAIAAGILDGRMLGASAHAALVTRGFAELRRFGKMRGARGDTLMGLSGLGDLLLTCGSPQSRNMSLGRALGQGRSLGDVLGARRSVSEGVYTAAVVTHIANAAGVAMPIATAVAGVMTGTTSVDVAIEDLLARPFKAED